MQVAIKWWPNFGPKGRGKETAVVPKLGGGGGGNNDIQGGTTLGLALLAI